MNEQQIDERLGNVMAEIANQLPVDAPDWDRFEQGRSDHREPPRWRRIAPVLAVAAAVVGIAVLAAVLLPRDERVSTTVPAHRPPSTTAPTRTTTVGSSVAPDPTTVAPPTTLPIVPPPTALPLATPTTLPPVAKGELAIRVTDRGRTAVVADVVDVSSGAERRTLGTWPRTTHPIYDPTFMQMDPILDAELTADGTAYLAVRVDLDQSRFGGSTMLALDASGNRRTILPNVTNLRISPDGTRAAVAVESPDGNGDGKATVAVRIVDPANGATRTLLSHTAPVDASGQATSETDEYEIEAWTADSSNVVVKEFCCDNGDIMVIPADGHGSRSTWPHIRHFSDTYFLGFAPDGGVLVQVRASGDTIETFDTIAVGSLDPASGRVTGPIFHDRVNSISIPQYGLVGSTIAGHLTERGVDALRSPTPPAGREKASGRTYA